MKPSYMRLLTPYLRNMSSADIESYASYASGVLSKSRLANSHGIIVKRSASVSVLHRGRHACMHACAHTPESPPEARARRGVGRSGVPCGGQSKRGHNLT